MKKILLAFALVIWSGAAFAQCNGVFPANTLCGNLSGSPQPPAAFSASGTVVGPGSSTVNDITTWANTGGTQIKDSGIGISTVAASPNPSIYGNAVIQSGLIPTWPTAALASCQVVSGGNSFTSNPTGTVEGGLTNGGTGGGTVNITESSGAVNSCSVTAGGNYSYPPVIFVSGGGGNSAQVKSTLGDTNSFTTSAGVIFINGVAVSVPSYTHTYPTTSNTTTAYCDFIVIATGAYDTQPAAFGSGNLGCTVPPSGEITLRVVWVLNGQVGSAGTQNGVSQIQYFTAMTTGFGWFATNSKDAPAQSTQFPGGNASPTGLNFACMMGAFGTRQGSCTFNANYLVFASRDEEPISYTNMLDGGPIFDFQRNTTDRAGVAGDLLSTFLYKGVDAGKNLVQFGEFLVRITNPGTLGNSYTDSTGEQDFYIKLSDGNVLRWGIGGGIYPPTSGGQECGQASAPTGGVALNDAGPSTINLCGSVASNLFGNPTGYYLDNNIVLQTSQLTLYGASAKVRINGSSGVSQTCTVNQAKTLIFLGGILTGGTCNT